MKDFQQRVLERMPSTEEERAVLGRVWNQAEGAGGRVPDEVLRSVQQLSLSRHQRAWTFLPRAAAAVLVLGAAIGTAIIWPRGVRVYAAGNDGLQVTLSDDSRVEMRAHSEMTVGRESDGIQIDLKTGDIIVTAARQRDGQLSVRTKDMTVALSAVARSQKADGGDTVFLVNAGQDGSRVGVIEGEVRVRERGTPLPLSVETRLRPGEQLTTSPTIAQRVSADDITWSRNADALNAILAAFEIGMARTAGPLTKRGAQSVNAAEAQQPGGAVPALQFEEASIRPCDPDNVPEAPAGARGGGANSFQMTPGRLHALCLTPATLIRTAYNYGPVDLEFLQLGGRAGRGMNFTNIYGLGVEDGRRIRGGPDWVRSEHYTIDAVADGAVDAETMRTTLLRALLESRFKLKAHVETEQIPAWTLTIAPSGLKIKRVDDGACEAQPAIGRGQPVIVRPGRPGERQPPPPSTPGQPVTVLFRNFVDVRKGEKPTCGISPQRNGPNQVIVAGGITLDALAAASAHRSAASSQTRPATRTSSTLSWSM